MGCRGRANGCQIVCCGAQRLFHQHALVGGQCCDDLRPMGIRRRADQHCIYRTVENLGVRCEDLPPAALAAEGFGAGPRAAVKGQFDLADEVFRVQATDGAAPYQTDLLHRFARIRSATRSALAAIVKLGFTPPEDGMKLPSDT